MSLEASTLTDGALRATQPAVPLARDSSTLPRDARLSASDWHDGSAMGNAMAEWYSSEARVRSFWAFGEGDLPNSQQRIRVLVLLDPTIDSDETSPVWLANAESWSLQLERIVGHAAMLELVRVDAQLPEGRVARGDPPLIAVLRWRDPVFNSI